MRSVRERFLNKKQKAGPEIKFSNSRDVVRQTIVREAAKLDITIYVLAIEKQYIQQKLREHLDVLYNYLVKVLLEKPIAIVGKDEHFEICLDKSMREKQRQNFESYVKTELFSKHLSLPSIEICHKDSSGNNHLQVTDFICGSFGYKYNCRTGDLDTERFSRIVNHKIVFEQANLFCE